MGRPKKVRAPLPPIWRLSDEQWALAEAVLKEHDPPAEKGPARVDQREVMDAVIFRLRTGCQWNRLPTEYPDDSTVHRHFQRWVERGVFRHLWASSRRRARIWAAATGSGKPPMARSGRPAWGEGRGPQPP
jgi:transposase